MGSVGLPSRSSTDLYLVEATPEESQAQLIVNSCEWKGVLNVEDYIHRETVAEDILIKEGGLTRWMLVWQPDHPNGPRQVLCGCETFKKKALVGKNGTVEDFVSHGIGSVFCPPDYRGQGYAGRMITELGERLKDWQGENVPFSILYSDIGKDFYRTRGWEVFPSAHVSLPPQSKDIPSDVRILEGEEDLADLCRLDEGLLRERMANSKSGRTTVALVPTYNNLRWHLSRQETTSKVLYKKSPSVHGAMAGEPGSRVWAYWTRVWANPEEEDTSTLHILRLVVENDSDSDDTAATLEGVESLKDAKVVRAIESIFGVAQTEAAKWDMGEVLLWNPSNAALAAAQRISPSSGVVHREKESIASLRWYASGSWEDVDWLANEKYGWC